MAYKLADETWATILERILDVRDDDFISHDTSLWGPFSQRDHSNADVLLVCKRWLRIATPLAFHTCIIRSTAQSQALSKALKKSPEFGILIKRLRLEGCYGASVPNVLEKATCLKDLAIALPYSSKDNGKPMFSVLGTLKPRRLIVCNSPRNTGNAQATYALSALRNFIKSCVTLNALVLLPYLARSISTELAASPSSILHISIWNQSPREMDYENAYELLATLRSLGKVEFIMSNPPCQSNRPSDGIIIRVGERIVLRKQGEQFGINLQELFSRPNERELAAATTLTLSSGRSILSHVPEQLQSTVWTHVLQYACEEGYPHLSPLPWVCRLFWAICTHHYLRRVTVINPDEAARANRMLERAIAVNPAAGRIVRNLHLGDATLNNHNPYYTTTPLGLIQTVIRHCSQLAVVTCWSMSVETFLLLASVSGRSLLQLTILRLCEEESRPEPNIAYLPSLRQLNVGTPSTIKATASNWSSVIIHAQSLLELELKDCLTTPGLLPSLIHGRLPQLRRLTISQQDSTSPHFSTHCDLIAAHGAMITECNAPMDLVTSVISNCPALEQLVVCAGRCGNQPTLVQWRAAFLATSPLISLRRLVFNASLLVGPALEDVPDYFTRDLFPILNEIQIRPFIWPQDSSSQREPRAALAAVWSERFAHAGIRVIDELGSKWRPRLATSQSRGRQAKRA